MIGYDILALTRGTNRSDIHLFLMDFPPEILCRGLFFSAKVVSELHPVKRVHCQMELSFIS